MNYTTPFENLKDKICVVTGGAGDIGSALAKSLASVGVRTVIIGRNVQKAKDFAALLEKEYQVASLGYGCDVVNKKQLEQVRDDIHARWGKIDFLINCAGGNHPKGTAKAEQIEDLQKDIDDSFFSFSLEGMEFVFDLNFMGTVLPSQVFGKDMVEKGAGAITNISSVSSFLPLTRVGAYSAAKAAINNFTQWLSVHLAHTGVRVNAIAPGFFLTEQNRFLLTDEQGNKTARGNKIVTNTPVGKFGDVDDLGGTALYLFSDMASFVNGAVIPVDGGFTAYGRV